MGIKNFSTIVNYLSNIDPSRYFFYNKNIEELNGISKLKMNIKAAGRFKNSSEFVKMLISYILDISDNDHL